MAVTYEWDEDKRLSNIAKHGLDFAEVAVGFDWANALLFDDVSTREEYRMQAFGWMGDRIVVLIFTMREERTRLISLRKATRQERRLLEDG